MPATISISPIASNTFDYAHAAHLLNRAGFGGTPRQIAALQKMGLDGAVDYLVDYQKIDVSNLPHPEYDSNIMEPYTPEEREVLVMARKGNDPAMRDKARAIVQMRRGEDKNQMATLEQWWLGRIIATPRPLEEKLVLLWHGHFASSQRVVRDSFLMLKQQAMFRHHANGSFAELAQEIVRDPAMLKYLNNDSNRRGHPNENLARELMELFTLGVGHYTEDDIKQGARALTGNAVEDNEFRFRPFFHDNDEKTILGKRGNFDGEAFVKILLEQPACPQWVCTKLYKHFVGDLDDKPTPQQEAVIKQLASTLATNKYNMAPVLKVMFKSKHFYDPAVMGNQVKSPIQLTAGLVRTLLTPTRDLDTLSDALGLMGQKLFEPPSVAGWDGGRGWINTSTLFVRQNLAAFLIAGKLPFDDGWTTETIEYDPTFLVQDLPAREPEAVVDHLMATLVGPQAAPQRRDDLLAFVKSRGGTIKHDTLIALLLLITAMPEYQLC